VAAGSYTTSTAFLEALAEAGVRYIFANLGSDHPGLIEALAQVRAQGREEEFPRLIVCPHEVVALSAAHAYAMVTGEPQAVVVHVDVGTLNLGGAVSNAARGRAPVFIFAGAAPYSYQGELPGGRNEFIQWIQDIRDQRGILRNYVKYDNEIRTGRNVKQLVHRALQIARSEPVGPVYLTAPREVMEEPVEPYAVAAADFTPVAPTALSGEVTAEIATALAAARRPLVVTSYLGRNPGAVPKLVELCELLAIPVLESMAYHVNFPADHPLHAGFQYHTVAQNPVLARADVILAIDSDVPWIPAVNRPSAGAAIYCVDVDPLKSQMSIWHVPARRFAEASARVAVEQITDFVRDNKLADPDVVEVRRQAAARARGQEQAERSGREQPRRDGAITAEYLTACVRRLIEDEDALVLTEVVTSSRVVAEHLRPNRPGSVLHHGGSALGWADGAVIGAKLAAPKFSTLQVHPDGAAAATGDFNVSFEPEVDLPGVARAAGAYGVTVSSPDELPQVLKDALAVVHGGRSAVVSVHLPPV